jgi:hypothetical protein
MAAQRNVCRKLLAAPVLCTLAVGLLLLQPARSRADHIDDKLIENSDKLVKALQNKGFKNVGVIKFMVKRGKDKLDATVGPINLNLATRVENALILGMDPDKPLGVIRDATQVAATADPKMSVRNQAGRVALFKHSYPLAWGKDKVSADAFLTGTVDLSVDMKATKVEIGYFDKKGDQIHELLAFTVATDRSILADSGQSFALRTRSLKGKRTLSELDDDAAKSAADADGGNSITNQLGGEMPIKFEIRYNNTSQTISADSSSSGEYSVPTPNKGDTISFLLTNTSKAKIGVVVKINGESTIGQEMNEDPACLKWILEPGKQYGLKGFYSMTDNSVTLFKVLDDDESAARMAEWSSGRPRAGYIDVQVFQESDVSDESLKVGRTLRGMSRAVEKKKHPATAAAARKLVQSLSNTAKSRGLIVAGEQKENQKIEEDQLKNAQPSVHMHINYYKPAGSATP